MFGPASFPQRVREVQKPWTWFSRFANESLETTPFFQIFFVYYLPPTTYYLPATDHLLPTYYLLPTTYRLLPTTYYLLPTTTYYLPPTKLLIHRSFSNVLAPSTWAQKGLIRLHKEASLKCFSKRLHKEVSLRGLTKTYSHLATEPLSHIATLPHSHIAT